MNMILWMALVIIVTLLLVFSLEKLRRKATVELDRTLYVENNPTLYLQLLDNPRLRWIYRRETLQAFRLDAYLMMQDDRRIKESMDILENAPLGKGAKLEFNTKKLSYYCLKQNKPKAQEALQAIHELLDQNKKEKYQNLLVESETIYKVYMEHDTSLIPSLIESIQKQSGLTKGISLFRVAKLYHYDSQDGKAKDCLKQAVPLVKGSTYEGIVDICTKKIKELENN